jgi:hypothetical protein
VLERVHDAAELRDVAGGVHAVVVPGREVAAGGRRVLFVVRGLEVLLLVARALVLGVDELAARGRGRLLEVGLLLGRDPGRAGRHLVGA